MSALRILYFADIRFPLERANGIQTAETCHALARKGDEVVLVVRPDSAVPPRDPWSFYGLPADARLVLEVVRARGPLQLRRATYLLRAAARTFRAAADLVMTRDLGVAGVLLALPRAMRPPLVYESHGLAPVVSAALPELLANASHASKAKQDRLRRRERRVWQHAEGYITITHALAEDLAALYGPRRRPLAVIPDGARVDHPRRFEPPARNARPVVCYAGHLYPWKGVDLLLHAISLLPDTACLIVGGMNGEGDLDRLRTLAHSLGIDERVRFTGSVAPSEVRPMLLRADVLVLPNTATAISERYTSPLKLFEYLAAGRPVVATDLAAVREVLADGRNAVLAPPGDPAALADAIRRVIDDSELAARIARQAFEDAAGFSWDCRAERIRKMFEAARRPTP
ncbi:MAG: glycosyltransferase family 4 protein [Vicinamibacterales bacterium]